MTLSRGTAVRISADLDPYLLECLRSKTRRTPTVELRDANGARMFREPCWISYTEATASEGLEIILVLGDKPGMVPIGPIDPVLVRPPDPKLLARDLEVLGLRNEGKNLTAIARELKITRHQVASSLRRARRRKESR